MVEVVSRIGVPGAALWPSAGKDEASRVNKELYKRNAELAVRNKTLALLRKLDEISLSSSGIYDMSRLMTDAIAAELGYEIVSLALVADKEKSLQWLGISSLVPWIQTALEGVDLKKVGAPLNDGLVSVDAVTIGKEVTSDDLRKVFPPSISDAVAATFESKVRDPVMHTMAYPLTFGEQAVGLLTLSTTRSLENVSQYEKESIIGIVGLISLAMYKASIYQDLQETTAELASANRQLKALDKAKSEFLSIASHQLYTPLTALRGYVSMMLEGDFGKMPEKQKNVLGILSTSTMHLIELIKGLLDISRIEAGRLELHLESLDLADITRQLVQDLMPNAMKKNLELEFENPPAKLPHVVADQERLRQVMLNFIDNAIKYTDKGTVHVSVTQEENMLMFSVKDTGKGISKEDIEKLFTKFTRVGGAARYHTAGTGLGLYVAKQIVKEHHGDVRVESEGEGKGSTFSVALPIEGSPESLKIGEKVEVDIKASDGATVQKK